MDVVGCGMDICWMWDGWIQNGWGMDVELMLDEYRMNVGWMLDGCGMDVG